MNCESCACACAMDAKNPHPHSTAHPPVADHHLQHTLPILPIVSRPAPWAHSNNNPAINQHQSYHSHPHSHPYSHPNPPQPSQLPPVLSPPSSTPSQPVPPHAPPSLSMVSEPHDETNAVQHSAVTDSARQNTGKNAVTKVRKPRKQGNASQGRSTLFWVHNDPQSVAEGTREETLKLIRSHVMSEHNRKKRLDTSKRSKSKTWKHLAFQPVETTASSSATAGSSATAAPSAVASSSRQASRRKPRKTARQTENTSSSSSSKSPSPDEHPQEEQDTAHADVDEEYPVASGDPVDSYGVDADNKALAVLQDSTPYTYIGQGTSDPFNTTHTPLSERMYRHLQHCKSSSLPNCVKL